MHAIVLTHPERAPFVQLMLSSYDEHWPEARFTFRVACGAEPPRFRTAHAVETIRSAKPIRDTMAALLEGLADHQFVYWCADDRYVERVLDRSALLALDSYVRSSAELPFDALRLINHTPPSSSTLVEGPVRLHRHGAAPARGFWHHAFVRVGVLREILVSAWASGPSLAEIRGELLAGRFPHRIVSVVESVVQLGEPTIENRITDNGLRALERYGLPVPPGFVRSGEWETFPSAGALSRETAWTAAAASRPSPRLVSVVLPARDAARTLDEQLTSLARQSTRAQYEIVVVDNASRDGTAATVERHREEAAIEIVACAEVGVNRARNHGIRAARGDVLLLCDADDVVSASWIAAMIDALDRFDVVGGRIEVERLNPAWALRSRPDPTEQGLPVGFGFLPYGVGANLGFHRRVFDALDGFDPDFEFGAEEIDFCWRAQYRGFRLGFAPDAVVHYRFKTRAGALFRQFRGYALGNARLYAKHLALGRLPRQSRRRQAGMTRDHLRRLSSAAGVGDPGLRLLFAARAGWSWGAIEGLVRHRVVV